MKEFLIKTMNEECYLQALLKKGQMLFRRASEFRRIEDGNIRGDITEGMQQEIVRAYIDPSVSTFYLGGENGGKMYGINWAKAKKDHPELANATSPFTFQINYVADVMIYCMTYINSATPNMDEIFFELQKLGKYSAVITNCTEFASKIKLHIPNAVCGLVNYSDVESSAAESNLHTLFTKSKQYELQSEFRVVKSSNGKTQETIEIGALSGFVFPSENLHTLKQML